MAYRLFLGPRLNNDIFSVEGMSIVLRVAFEQRDLVALALIMSNINFSDDGSRKTAR